MMRRSCATADAGIALTMLNYFSLPAAALGLVASGYLVFGGALAAVQHRNLAEDLAGVHDI